MDCAFQRDEQKQHLAFLSGGLDSRVVVYTAHKLGYRDFETLTFSEPNYLDHKIAKDIAKELDLKMHFYSLGEGKYLLNLPENLAYNEGQIILHGSAHLYNAIRSLPLEDYGVLHSGQLGDMLKGCFLQANRHTPVNLETTAHSAHILSSFASQLNSIRDRYPHHEAFSFYNRGLNSVINGDLASYKDSYSLSPFLDPEFMQYILNLDPALRLDNRLFLKWMKHSFATAAKHKWERTGTKASAPFLIVKLNHIRLRGSAKFKIMFSKKPNRRNMNPFDYWWQSNPDLRKHFEQQRALLEELKPLMDTELYHEMLMLANSQNFSKKMQAYSLVFSSLYLMGKYDLKQLQP